jgi:hypothetical protein
MIFLLLAKVARARRLAGDLARRALGSARATREIVPLRAAHAVIVDRQSDRELVSLVAGELRGWQALALSTGDGARVQMDGSVRIAGERIYLNS